MPSDSPPVHCKGQPPFWRDQLNLIVPCSLLALLFTLFGMGPLWLQLVYANGIGLTMRTTIRWLQRNKPALSMTLNTLLALALAGLLWLACRWAGPGGSSVQPARSLNPALICRCSASYWWSAWR